MKELRGIFSRVNGWYIISRERGKRRYKRFIEAKPGLVTLEDIRRNCRKYSEKYPHSMGRAVSLLKIARRFFLRRIRSASRPVPASPRKESAVKTLYKDGCPEINCVNPFTKLVIHCDGEIHCGTPEESAGLGNVLDDNIWDAWNSGRMQKIRSGIINKSPVECGNCKLHSWGIKMPEPAQKTDVMEKRLKTLLVEPTVACNLDCPISCGKCAPASLSLRNARKFHSLPMKLYRKVIDETSGKVEKLGLFNFGEPFLHPEITEMISYARKMSPEIFIYTSTNGMPLKSRQLLDGVISSGIDEILFSIDGASQGSYEKYRKGGDFKSLMEIMEKIMVKRRNGRPRIIWRYILFAWNDSPEELKKAEQIARGMNIDRFCYHLSDIVHLGSSRYKYGRKEFEEIAPFLDETDRFEYKYSVSVEKYDGRVLELSIKNTGDIRWNSVEKPWERFVYFELFAKERGSSGCEILHKQKLGKDIKPGEGISVQFMMNDSWLLNNTGRRIYFDCVLNGSYKFREHDHAPFELTGILKAS